MCLGDCDPSVYFIMQCGCFQQDQVVLLKAPVSLY